MLSLPVSKSSANRRIRNIPTGTFGGLSFRSLDIQRTGVSIISCDVFNGISETLSRISLRNNWLTRVPSCALARFRSAIVLDLAKNNISALATSDFASLTRLQELKLEKNRIITVVKGTFTGR